MRKKTKKINIHLTINGETCKKQYTTHKLLINILQKNIKINKTHTKYKHNIYNTYTIIYDNEDIQSYLIFTIQNNNTYT